MKKDYSAYQAADFARDADFLRWVKYPLRDEALNDFWTEWVKQHPRKRTEIEEARQLIFAVLEESYAPADHKQAEVWSKIRMTLHAEAKTVEMSASEKKPALLYMKIAATIILIAGVSFGTYYLSPSREVIPQAVVVDKPVLIKEENVTKTGRTVVLPDGSSVILKPQSAIQYPKELASEVREVYLTGEAFFEVKRDPTKPFLVYTNEIVTRVLGTSFTVRSFENENVVVQVKTGTVSVFKANEKKKGDAVEGVVLSRNQQVVYERDEMKLSKSLIEEPLVLGTNKVYDFEYKDTPLKDVFVHIEDAYGVDIVYDEETLGNCRLNASLRDAPLYDKLRLVCKGINAEYELLESHIVIYGKGCKIE